MHAFDGIAAKVRLAQVHLKELEDDFASFKAEKFYEIRTELDAEKGLKKAVFYATAPLPLAWSAMLGEILYDLRSALDHAVYLVTEKCDSAALDKWTAFPVCLFKSQFHGSGPKDKRSGRWKLRGMPDEAIALIKRIQPYKVKQPNIPEETTLAVFDELANIDKHRTLNLCRMRALEIKSSPLNGMMTVKSMYWTLPGKLEDGTVIAYWEPAGELNDEVEMDIDLDFVFALDDGGPKVTHGRSVVGSVHEFGLLVNEVLKALRTIYDKP